MTVSPLPEWPGLPETGPATLEGVKLQVSIPADDLDTDAELERVVSAVNVIVRTLPVSAAAVDLTDWPASIVLGADMLGGRVYRRKNSPAGVVAFGEQGAAYVMRNDPDIGMLLQLGPYAKPGIA